MTEDTIDYSQMVDHAMRGVVRDILKQVSVSGIPGDHHFYISFDTTYPGVKISETLKEKYPKDVTIVLQHQFWDFKVEEDQFHVTLSFSGVPENLVVPFASLTAFADPSTKFGLQFQQIDMYEAEIIGEEGEEMLSFEDMVGDDENDDESAEVISLDSFRKK
ncbi:MAG: SspB family protein [Rickettsiales bacterium]